MKKIKSPKILKFSKQRRIRINLRAEVPGNFSILNQKYHSLCRIFFFENKRYRNDLSSGSKWAFPKKELKPPCWRYQWNFPGGRVKVVGITGGMSKFEWKTRISKGVNAKKLEIPGGHYKIDWKLTGNPGGQLQKKLIFSTGGYNFFLEKPNFYQKLSRFLNDLLHD